MNLGKYNELVNLSNHVIPKLSCENTTVDAKETELRSLKATLISWDVLSFISQPAVDAELQNLLEHAVYCSVSIARIRLFEFFYDMLKILYFDYPVGKPSEQQSIMKHEIFAMRLIHLLAMHKTTQFHSELELLSGVDIMDDVFLKYAVLMEQCLLEGNYNRIYLGRDNAPSPFIRFFVDLLILSIRNEIASCVERSYQMLTVKDAQSILHCDSEQALWDIIKQRKWNVDSDGTIQFDQKHLTEKRIEQLSRIDHKKYIQQFLEYTRAIEAII